MPPKNGPTSLLLIAFLSFAIIGVPGGALGVAWIHIQATFGLGLDSLGVLLTSATIGRLFTAFFSGCFVAWMGMGRYLLGGSVVGLVGILGFAMSPSWPLLMLAYFIVGLGSGVIDAGVNMFVAPRYSASRMNWLHACFGVGLTFGPMLVTLLVLDLGQSWRWCYGVLAGLQGLLVVAFALTLSRWRVQPGSIAEADGPTAPMGATLRLVMTWLSLAMFFVYGGAEIGTGQLLNSLLVEARSIAPKTAGSWVSIYWASFTIGRMLIGIFVDAIGPRSLLRISMIGTMLGAVLIWWNPVIEASFAGLVVMGFSLAAVFPTLVSVTPDRVGLSHTPNAIGFQIGFAGLGAAILVGVAGFLAEMSGRGVIAPFLVVISLVTFLIHEIILRREQGLARKIR